MSTIRRILVATDFSPGSDAAVERAVQLAAAHDATLCVLHAFDASAWHDEAVRRLHTGPAPEQRVRQRLSDAAASIARQAGIEVETHFDIGPPLPSISACARAQAVSLIVVGSRADPEVAGLGSTASKVVRSPACAVLIVRAAHAPTTRRVLSAVDLRDGSVRALSFALELFPAARHHLLYALDPAPEHTMAIGGLTAQQLQPLHASMYARADAALQELAGRLGARALHPLTAEVADDLPARAILVGAAALPADCVVVGHHGEGTTIPDSIPGNLAQHVIQYTPGDVLVVP